MSLVESLIQKSTIPGKTTLVKTKDGEGVHSTNTFNWIVELANEIISEMPKKGNYDGNMGLSFRMGVILLMWYTRVHRAKTMDPRRPIKVRKESYESWLASQAYLITHLYDDRDDATVWPGQEWNQPWGKKAKGGKFV